MGSSAAWWMARRGRDVVVLERFPQGHARGSSHGGSRIFRLAYPEPEYVRMAQEALYLWRSLEEDAQTTLLETTGGVDHGKGVAAASRALDACGVPHEMLPAEQAAERWCGMRFEGPVLLQSDGGRALADTTVRALQDRAVHHGAELRFEEGMNTLEIDGGGVAVRTDIDEYRAGVAVIACGAWSAKVLEGVVPLPPLSVTQEQIFHFAPRDQALEWPSFIYHDLWIYGLLTPGEGVKVAEHHTGLVVDPDLRNFEIDAVGRGRVVQRVEEWFPGLVPEPVTSATCLYTTTPTEDFVIDSYGPLVVAAGFSGHGFKFTPLIGRLLADLAEGRQGPGARFRLSGGVP